MEISFRFTNQSYVTSMQDGLIFNQRVRCVPAGPVPKIVIRGYLFNFTNGRFTSTNKKFVGLFPWRQTKSQFFQFVPMLR